MIVDTSALIAIQQREPGHERLIDALIESRDSRIAAPTLVELCVVMTRRRGAQETDVRATLDEFGIRVAEFTPAQAWAAGEAYRRYGPDSGSKARLNLGDCFSYALASLSGEALLFVGNDFSATDVRSAIAPR